MRMNSRSVVISLVAVAVWIAWPSVASAQVVIDMPAPPKKKHTTAPPPPGEASGDAYSATVKTSSSTTSVGARYPVSVEQYDVGDVALVRYSGVRYGTYDTYYSDDMYPYNGMHYYPRYYPQYVWGWPWWGWGFWPGFSFGFHCH